MSQLLFCCGALGGLGFKAFLHIPAMSPEEELAVCRAIQEALKLGLPVGPFTLLVVIGPRFLKTLPNTNKGALVFLGYWGILGNRSPLICGWP